MHRTQRTLYSVAVLGAALFLGTAARSRAQYNVAADFSTLQNPNGVWQYGESATELGAFSLYTHGVTTDVGLPGWNNATTGTHPPYVDYNNTGAQFTGLTATYSAGGLGQHPGSLGEYSMSVFTAPTAGTYSISGAFTGIDFHYPTSTDDHVVLQNGATVSSLFDVNVNEYGVAHPFTLTQFLGAGESIRFETGYGTNGNFVGDSTGLSANITAASAVPELGSGLSFGGLIAIAGLGLVRRRRSR